eukprot:XP_011676752.1 PREDICTED: deleted in malignant brain tumors 1 protein-like [Strongylocentrotus purpuratus]
MLEYDGALSAPGNATYGQGSGNYSWDSVDCVGTEDHLLDCPKVMGAKGCTQAENAGAICYSEAPFRVRLVGGTSVTEGRVEVMYDGSWGTICDDAWGLKDATVVCRMLGFEGALAAPGNASFGRGSGNVLLDGVTCDGSEDNLAECSHNGVGVHDCDHGEDAGVRCFSGVPFKVRLIGGPDDSEGRVEIFYDGSWQTVCDNNWDFKEAKVVCRMLGFDGALAAPRAAAYGQGSGGILLDSLGCDGTEDKIADCYHRGVGVHNCEHANDAGVRCFSGTDPFQVRLIGSVDDAEGRVEVLYDGSWGTICDSDWDIRDATVVCRMLDFDGAMEATHSARFGKGSGDSILEGVRCRGREDHLAECLHAGFGSNVCDHEKDAGVICYSNVRLVGGSSDAEGRVEVQHMGVWGTICHDQWDILDATVVCRMLGFQVRLVGGSSDAEGRVEIQHMGVWGTICHDQWDILDATVVCRMLGFQGALKAPGSAYFGKGAGDIFLDEVQCAGTESRLTDCKHRGIGEHNCAHIEDASVVCDDKGGMSVKMIVGAVVGSSIMLLIIIGVASLVYYRRKKTKDRAEENPVPFAVSKTTGPTKDLAQGEGIQVPPNPPNRPLTLPRVSMKRDVKPAETMFIYQSPKPEDGGLDDIDEERKHLYMSMESEYLAPSAVIDDVCIPSLELGSDAPADVPAAVEESVYMGDDLS